VLQNGNGHYTNTAFQNSNQVVSGKRSTRPEPETRPDTSIMPANNMPIAMPRPCSVILSCASVYLHSGTLLLALSYSSTMVKVMMR
jgi:hypothetical protein